MKKTIPLYILFLTFMFNVMVLNANEISSILIEGKYRVFIEIGNDENYCRSVYAFILPVENNLIKKTTQSHNCFDRADTTVLESITLNLDLEARRYQLDNGFVFYRSSKDTVYYAGQSHEEIN